MTMTTNTDPIEAARTALVTAMERRTALQEQLDKAKGKHDRAVTMRDEAQTALRAIVAHEDERSAAAAARLADAIRSGDAASIDDETGDHAARAEAERRLSIANGAVDALATDVRNAAAAVTAAANGVTSATRHVLIAHRDVLTADLTEKTAAFLDARHRLMGLLDSRIVPATDAATGAVHEVDRQHPAMLHPASFAVRSWQALLTALETDPTACYAPVGAKPVEAVDPYRARLIEQRKIEDAERAASAEQAASRGFGFQQGEMMTARHERLLSGT